MDDPADPYLRPDICAFHPKCADDGEESWHHLRTCAFCGTEWCGLHCPCDGNQNPCPGCGRRPEWKPCPGYVNDQPKEAQ